MALPPLRVVDAGAAFEQANRIEAQRQNLNALNESRAREGQIRRLLSGGLPADAESRNALVNKAVAIDPNAGFSLQQRFSQLDEADRAELARESETLARLFVGIDSPAGFNAALGEADRLGIDVGRFRDMGFSPQTVDMIVRPAREIEDLIAANAPREGFEDVLDATGNIIGQRNTLTGRVVTDPRASTLLSPAELAQAIELRQAGRSKGGGTNVTVGGSTVNLTPGATTALQKDVLNTQGLRSRLDTIASSFRPEFLTLPTQVGQSFNAFRERVLSPLGVGELSTEEAQTLRDFTAFQRDTVDNLSRFVSDLSGAAVTPQEAERLGKSLPLMEDSPTEFQAKLNAAIRQANRALARANFALSRGLDPLNSGLTLEGIEETMAREEARIRRAESARLPADQVEAEVERQLRIMFGL